MWAEGASLVARSWGCGAENDEEGCIGTALGGEALIDPRIGRHMNADLVGYHVPVRADIPPIDIEYPARSGRASAR